MSDVEIFQNNVEALWLDVEVLLYNVEVIKSALEKACFPTVYPQVDEIDLMILLLYFYELSGWNLVNVKDITIV